MPGAMSNDSRAAGPAAAVDQPVRSEASLGRRHTSRWALFTGVALLVLAKTLALGELEHHRVGILALLGLGLAFSVLRPRPVAVAVTAGGLLAVALAPHPLALGVAVAVGSCLLLIALFFAIAAVLHARQGHDLSARASPSVCSVSVRSQTAHAWRRRGSR